MNNGVIKVGTAAPLVTLHATLGLDAVWQLHRTVNDGAENSPEAFIANLDGGDKDLAAWLKLSASENGRFAVTNGRTGWTKIYD